MWFLEPLVMLQSLQSWCLCNVAPVDLATQKLSWSYSETFRRDKDRGIGASLLQLSLPGCEGSELFHTDLCNGTDAFMPKLPV